MLDNWNSIKDSSALGSISGIDSSLNNDNNPAATEYHFAWMKNMGNALSQIGGSVAVVANKFMNELAENAKGYIIQSVAVKIVGDGDIFDKKYLKRSTQELDKEIFGTQSNEADNSILDEADNSAVRINSLMEPMADFIILQLKPGALHNIENYVGKNCKLILTNTFIILFHRMLAGKDFFKPGGNWQKEFKELRLTLKNLREKNDQLDEEELKKLIQPVVTKLLDHFIGKNGTMLPMNEDGFWGDVRGMAFEFAKGNLYPLCCDVLTDTLCSFMNAEDTGESSLIGILITQEKKSLAERNFSKEQREKRDQIAKDTHRVVLNLLKGITKEDIGEQLDNGLKTFCNSHLKDDKEGNVDQFHLDANKETNINLFADVLKSFFNGILTGTTNDSESKPTSAGPSEVSAFSLPQQFSELHDPALHAMSVIAMNYYKNNKGDWIDRVSEEIGDAIKEDSEFSEAQEKSLAKKVFNITTEFVTDAFFNFSENQTKILGKLAVLLRKVREDNLSDHLKEEKMREVEQFIFNIMIPEGREGFKRVIGGGLIYDQIELSLLGDKDSVDGSKGYINEKLLTPLLTLLDGSNKKKIENKIVKSANNLLPLLLKNNLTGGDIGAELYKELSLLWEELIIDFLRKKGIDPLFFDLLKPMFIGSSNKPGGIIIETLYENCIGENVYLMKNVSISELKQKILEKNKELLRIFGNNSPLVKQSDNKGGYDTGLIERMSTHVTNIVLGGDWLPKDMKEEGGLANFPSKDKKDNDVQKAHKQMIKTMATGMYTQFRQVLGADSGILTDKNLEMLIDSLMNIIDNVDKEQIHEAIELRIRLFLFETFTMFRPLVLDDKDQVKSLMDFVKYYHLVMIFWASKIGVNVCTPAQITKQVLDDFRQTLSNNKGLQEYCLEFPGRGEESWESMVAFLLPSKEEMSDFALKNLRDEVNKLANSERISPELKASLLNEPGLKIQQGEIAQVEKDFEDAVDPFLNAMFQKMNFFNSSPINQMLREGVKNSVLNCKALMDVALANPSVIAQFVINSCDNIKKTVNDLNRTLSVKKELTPQEEEEVQELEKGMEDTRVVEYMLKEFIPQHGWKGVMHKKLAKMIRRDIAVNLISAMQGNTTQDFYNAIFRGLRDVIYTNKFITGNNVDKQVAMNDASNAVAEIVDSSIFGEYLFGLPRFINYQTDKALPFRVASFARAKIFSWVSKMALGIAKRALYARATADVRYPLPQWKTFMQNKSKGFKAFYFCSLVLRLRWLRFKRAFAEVKTKKMMNKIFSKIEGKELKHHKVIELTILNIGQAAQLGMGHIIKKEEFVVNQKVDKVIV